MHSVSLIDNDGKKYDFKLFAIDQPLPVESSILLVASKPTTENPGIIYLSCNSNLATAFSEEARIVLKNEFKADTVGFYFEGTHTHCKKTLNSLLKKYDPPCNL